MDWVGELVAGGLYRMLVEIAPEQVRLGMYIRGFGGSWLDHPFWRVKFVLRNPADVLRVNQSGVPYVIIDTDQGVGVEIASTEAALATRLAPVMVGSAKRSASPRQWNDFETTRQDSDKQRAKTLVARSMRVLRGAFADVRLGRAIRMSEVTAVVDDVVEMIERNPRTLLEMLRLKKKNEYTYMHSIAVCTLMANLARHMGKRDAEMREYGMAGLLHDLGKMNIPDAILDKQGKLTAEEFRKVRAHPEYGYRMLQQSPNMPQIALDVCRHHHEKIDGSGYPFGLTKDAISLVARLGAICDVYDALTSERVYKEAWSPATALAAMWSWDGHFDRDLLFTFMQSVGVFPSGMLVELRSNRLALVLENKRRNTRPRVVAFYSTRERSFLQPDELVIQDNLANDSIIAPAEPQDWGFDNWALIAERLKQGESAQLAA